jgi:hypothetical protein
LPSIASTRQSASGSCGRHLRQDLDSESLVDQLWGACYHRLLLTGLPVTDTFVETLLGNLLAGIRPAPGRRRSSPSHSARRSAARLLSTLTGCPDR